MSYNLNSLKGVIWGIIYGTTIGVIKGDTRSLEYSSYVENLHSHKAALSERYVGLQGAGSWVYKHMPYILRAYARRA